MVFIFSGKIIIEITALPDTFQVEQAVGCMVQIPITHKLSYLICGTLAVPAASTDCVKGRCNRDIPTIDVSSYPHALQIFLHSVTRLKKHKKNILDISVHLLPAMALLLSAILFLIFSLLHRLSSCLGFSHIPGQGAEKSSYIVQETNSAL